MLIVNQQGANSDSIARFKKDGKDLVKIQFDGSTSFENNKIIKINRPEQTTKDGANKAYVDEKKDESTEYTDKKYEQAKSHADVGDRKIREDLEAEVNDLKDQLADLKFDSTMLNAPARMRFKYGTYAEPQPKQFTWDRDKGWLFISLKSDNGVDMTRYLINDTMDVDMEHGPIVSIWYYNSSDNNWEMMLSAECDLVRWNQDGKKIYAYTLSQTVIA